MTQKPSNRTKLVFLFIGAVLLTLFSHPFLSASSIFETMGFGEAEASVVFVIVNALINCLATFPGMWLVEKVGRKKSLVGGGNLFILVREINFKLCINHYFRTINWKLIIMSSIMCVRKSDETLFILLVVQIHCCLSTSILSYFF